MLSVYVVCAMALLSLQDGGSAASLTKFQPNSDNNQIDNSLEVNAGVNFEPVRPHWVEISKELPPVLRRSSGSRAELECAASGSPAPIITWLRDNVPITEAEDYENNALIEGSETGVVKARARLIINNFLPIDKIKYTCMATAGSKTAFSSTIVHTTHNGANKPTNLSEYLLLNQEVLSSPAKPRILSYYQTVLENADTTLILPCKATGNPRPEVYWMDSDDNIISNQDPRVKVMNSGELIIQSLRWSDMGLYTCVARNALGKDTISTFVYPTTNN